MNEKHPDRETLLRYSYDLLDENEREPLRQHIAHCESCAEAARAALALEKNWQPRPPELHRPHPLGKRLWISVAAPISIMAITITLAALLEGVSVAMTPALVFLGGFIVVIWLHSMASRTERSWSVFVSETAEGPTLDAEEQSLVMTGAILSWTESLRRTRRQILTVVITAAALAAMGAIFIATASAVWPHQTATAVSERSSLLGAAIALGLLLAGGLWANLRLLRVAQRASRWVATT